MYDTFKIVAAIVLIYIALYGGHRLCGEIFAPDNNVTTDNDGDGITGRYHLRGQTTQFFE